MKVAFIGSHPDDVEIGCGSTMYQHVVNGDEVYIIVLTKGEKGNHDNKELFDSLLCLSIDPNHLTLLDMPDGNVKFNQNSVNVVENILNDFKIDRVYTHYFDEKHQDHRNCYKIVDAASKKVKQILCYEGPSTKNFNRQYLIPSSKDAFLAKMDALNCYKTQIKKHTIQLEKIKLISLYNGYSCESNYAEAFYVEKFVEL